MKNIVILILFFPFLLCAQSQPNIVFVFADDLGHGDISRNDATYSTPNIDSLARNGAYFTRFYTRAACTPSRFSLFTGKHAFRGNQVDSTNFDQFVQYPYENIGIHPTEHTLFERMSEQGYYTMGIGKWHLGTASPDHSPMKHGFNRWLGSNWGFTDMYAPFTTRSVPTMIRDGYKVKNIPSGTWLMDVEVDTFNAWIMEQAADTTAPFLAYYAMTAPHTNNEADPDTIPYKASDFALAPGGYTTDQKRRWANLKAIDDAVGSIWSNIRTLGIENNTIIIFTSDNGARTNVAGLNTPFTRAGKPSNAEGGIRVPMIWYHLGSVDSMTVDSVTCLEDMMPTFIEGVCGRNLAKADTIDGVSFYPLLSGNAIAQRTYIGTWIPGYNIWCVIRGKYKLINNITLGSTVASGSSTNPDDIRLYNVVSDQTESTDLSGSHASVVSQLQAIIDEEPTPKRRTVQTTAPVGWVDPRWWGDPVFWYNVNYIFHTSQIDK